MNFVKTISGPDAIEQMRWLKRIPGAYFSMIHFTCNLKDKSCGELRKVERCRLRVALKEDDFQVNGDHYLPYEDLDSEIPYKQCFKKLIRYVAFPPNYEFIKVKWFDNE